MTYPTSAKRTRSDTAVQVVDPPNVRRGCGNSERGGGGKREESGTLYTCAVFLFMHKPVTMSALLKVPIVKR